MSTNRNLLKIAAQKTTSKHVDSQEQHNDGIKYLHRREGAFAAYSNMALIAQIQQADTLLSIHESKEWKNLGFNSFEEYAMTELHVGRTRVYEIFSCIKKLKPEIYGNINLLNFSNKHIKLLADNVEETNPGENTILLNGKVIELSIDNRDFILDEIQIIENERQKAEQLAFEEKKTREELQEKFTQIEKQGINTVEMYRLKLDEISLRFQSILSPLEELAREAKTDKSKRDLLISYVHQIDTLIMTKKETLLDDVE